MGYVLAFLGFFLLSITFAVCLRLRDRQRSLQKRLEEFEAIVENCRQGIVTLDCKGLVEHANQATCEMTGYGQDEIIGQDFSRFLLTASSESSARAVLALLDEGSQDWFFIRKNGTLADVRIMSVRNRLQDKIFVFMSDSAAFVKEKLPAISAKEMHEARESKDIFLAMMSHEIRTPLVAMMGYIEVLSFDEDLPTKHKDILDGMIRNGKHLSNIINDILDSSRARGGKNKPAATVFNLMQEIATIETIFKLELLEKALTFRITSDPSVPTYVKSRPTLIKQILINIIGNAIKFTESGIIHMAIAVAKTPEREKAKLVFTIRDTGCGIELSNQKDIFKTFSTSNQDFGGTGLGLSLSRSIARQLGGDVVLKESYVGKGSAFEASVEVELVKDDVPVQVKPSQQEIGPQLQDVRILIVEDELDVQLIYKRILMRSGAKIRIASSGLEALELARVNTFDIVLMDINIPIINGYQTAEILRRKGLRIPILAITAHFRFDEMADSLAGVFNAHLEKPVSAANLVQTIRTWITPADHPNN